jgi:hypothetical protein
LPNSRSFKFNRPPAVHSLEGIITLLPPSCQ